MPSPAALILVYWEEKGGAKRLLIRYINLIMFQKMIWYLPTILLLPAIWFLANWMTSLSRDLPAPPQSGALAFIVVFIMVFISGSTEEIAWMGYAHDPLEDKWKTIKATLILAIVWILCHVPAFYYLHPTLAFTGMFAMLMIA